MKELLTQYEEQLKKLSKEDKELLIAQLLHQKKQSREKSREIAAKKRAKGIKPIAIELPADQLKKFKSLVEQTGMTKTELLIEMMKWYEMKINNKAA
jgi:hypothetical protein